MVKSRITKYNKLKRRIFIKKTGQVAASSVLINPFVYSYNTPEKYISKRPPIGERLFISQVIEEEILEVKSRLKDPALAWVFENCFPNTLDTTVFYKEKDGRSETHIITGDINAMWLRDSTCQVWPYIPFANKDENLKKMLEGLIYRQVDCVLIDPYANAFKKDISEPVSKWAVNDITDMKPELHERKWEINSLLFVIRLAHKYWKVTGDSSPFDDKWEKAMLLLYQTLKEQQRFDGPGPYHFQRPTLDPADAIANKGYGQPTRKNGMIHAIFRQDDANIFNLYVPDNIMAITELKNLAEMLTNLRGNKGLADKCLLMSDQIKKAIYEDAIIEHKVFGKILAFEIDGYGSQLLMDDPTLPGLMNLPSMGYWDINDQVYQNTRNFILSEWNPSYEKGKAGEGFGSAHYPKGRIWPLGTISRAMTAENEEEIKFCLNQLVQNHMHTGFMHETYSKDDALDFTRPWFAWVNTYFGELILKVIETNPSILT